MTEATAAGDGRDRPSPAYAYYVLAVLTLAYVLNFIDRSILAILLEPIKEELDVSDTQMGLLSGFAFSLIYASLSLPVAFISDRRNRRNMLMVGVALWSAMTSLCGLSRSYAELFAARMLVGLGEATGTAPAFAIISDYFPPARRAWVMSVYSCGIFVGIMLSLLGGGLMAQYLGWRAAFLVLGPPGLILAALIFFTVREPVRGQFDEGPPPARVSVLATLRHLVRQRDYVLAVGGLTAMSIALGAFAAWAPTVLIRAHGMSIGMVGAVFGCILGIGGVVGALSGGQLAMRLGVSRPFAAAAFPGLASIASAPFFAAFCLLDSTVAALAFYAVAVITSGMHFGPAFALTQNAIPATMRSVAASLSLITTTLAGSGFGPLLAGWLSDQLAPRFGADAIRYGLLGPVVFIGVAFLLFYALAASKNPKSMAVRAPA